LNAMLLAKFLVFCAIDLSLVSYTYTTCLCELDILQLARLIAISYLVLQFRCSLLIFRRQSLAMSTLPSISIVEIKITHGAKNSARTRGLFWIVSSKSAAVKSRTSLDALTVDKNDNEAVRRASNEVFAIMLTDECK
jgi:hypothetical protein